MNMGPRREAVGLASNFRVAKINSLRPDRPGAPQGRPGRGEITRRYLERETFTVTTRSVATISEREAFVVITIPRASCKPRSGLPRYV